MRYPARLWLLVLAIAGPCATHLQGQGSAASRVLKLLEDAKRPISEIRPWNSEKSELLQGIAIAQARAGDAKASEQTFQEILSAASEKEETRSVALAKVRAGDLKGAIALAEPLKDGWILVHKDPLSGQSSTRVGSLRTDTLERIADLLVEGKRWKDAREVIRLLPETKREGHPDDLTSKQEALMKLAIAQARAGEPEIAHLTAKEVVSRYYKEQALQDVVAAHVKRGELTVAQQSVEEITFPHLKLPSYLAIAAGQSATGDPKGATATFAKAFAMASSLIDFSRRGTSSRVSALIQIAVAQAKAGDRVAAKETVNQAIEGSDELDLEAIALGQAKLGAFDLAVARANLIQVPWRKVHALIGISVELSRAGERAKAAELFSRALTIAKAVKEDYVRTATLLEVGKGQLQAGDIGAAVDTARDMMEISEKWDLLHLIVKDQVAAGDLKGAQSTVAFLTGGWMKVLALREIALAQTRGGEAKAAAELVTSFQGHIREVCFGEISSILIDLGDMELALQTVSRMEMTESTGRALRKIATAQVRKGDEAGALTWAAVQKGRFQRAYALLGVAEGILEKEGRGR